jgi:hypothetical protein
MRGLSITCAVLVSTAVLSAQRSMTPPPHAAHPIVPVHPVAPVRPIPPPTVLPFPPLPTQPTGGFTSGFVFPPQVHPAYIPGRSGRGYGSGSYGGYGGGYFYAPDTQTTSAPAASAQQPPGLLQLTGTPGEAQVFVDGFYVATLANVEEQRALTLSPGAHHIELRAPDYTSDRFDVRIDPNATVSYRASLDHVRAAPPAASATTKAGSTKMYLIPNCYLGNVPPKAGRLPQGCDIKRVQVIS